MFLKKSPPEFIEGRDFSNFLCESFLYLYLSVVYSPQKSG